MATTIRGSDNFDTAVNAPAIAPNAWHISLASTTDFTVANSTLTFNETVHKGGNLTQSSGKITVSVAGMYLISFMGARYQTTDGIWDWSIMVNSAEIPNSRVYVSGNNGGTFDSTSMTVPIQLAAGDVVFIRGVGNCYGAQENSMTFFTGVRLGV